MLRSLRKWWLCRRYGICPTHGVLRPHGDYHTGRWGICPTCSTENAAKNHYRDLGSENRRLKALERLNRDWTIKSEEARSG